MASARNRNQPTREKMFDARESALVRDGERLRMVKACVGSLKHRGMELGAELFTRASEADALSDKAVSEGETYLAVGNTRGRRPKPALVLRIMLKHLDALSDGLVPSKLVEAFVQAIKTEHYESRLYILRVLLERVPKPRMEVLTELTELLHRTLFGFVVTRGCTASIEEDEPLCTLSEMFAPRVFRTARNNTSREHNEYAVRLVGTLLREFRYLILYEKQIVFVDPKARLKVQMPGEDEDADETISFSSSTRGQSTFDHVRETTSSASRFNPTDILRSVAASKIERKPKSRILLNETKLPPWLQEHSTDFWQPSVFPPMFQWDPVEREKAEMEPSHRKKLRKRAKGGRIGTRRAVKNLSDNAGAAISESGEDLEDFESDEQLSDESASELDESEAYVGQDDVPVDESDQDEVPVIIRRKPAASRR